MSKRRAASEDGDTSDSSADASARKRRGGHGARGALDAAPEFMQLSNEAAASGRSSRASSRASSRSSSREQSPQRGVVGADPIVPAPAAASALTDSDIYGMVETLASQSAGEDLSQFGWRCYYCL